MKIRRIRRICGVVLLAVLCAVSTISFWLGFFIKPLLQRQGVEWAHHESGWRSLTLRKVTFANETLTFAADTIELKSPLYWLGSVMRNRSSLTPCLRVTGWSVTLHSVDSPVSEPESGVDTASIMTRMNAVGRLWNQIARFIPYAVAENGWLAMVKDAGPVRVQIERVQWKHAELLFRLAMLGEDGSKAEGEGMLRLEWPGSGAFQFSLNQEGTALAPLFPVAVTEFAKPSGGRLLLRGGWDRGPLSFSIRQKQSMQIREDLEAVLHLSLEAGLNGLELLNFAVDINGERVVNADGRLPLILNPSSIEQPLQLDHAAPFYVRASTVPDVSLWMALEELWPLRIIKPVLIADIEGTLNEPKGHLRLVAEEIFAEGFAVGNIQSMTDLRLDLLFVEDAALIEQFSFRIANQPVSMTAKLPLGEDAWKEMVFDRRFPHWTRLEGTLKIRDAELVALSEYIPEIMAPAGRLSADIRFLSGAQAFGTLEVSELSTRAIMPLGTLSEIGGNLRFDGRSARITHLSGMIGDQPVSVSGSVSLRDEHSLDYDLRLEGENIPMIRRPGLMLRGDLDLRLTGEGLAAQNGRISGVVNLRNGYFLSELKLPGGGNITVPEQRPPFFSVYAEPFSGWTIDLTVAGREFMQIRTPVFNGLLSADFRLHGTLHEPLSPGVVTIERGSIRFPFATLGVERGTLELTHEDPYRAQLDIMSSGRVFGYDIRMELRGTADDPVLVFSATPPLGSDAVLMMLTAGVLPDREIEFTGQQRAARMALFLGQNLLYELTGDENVGERLIIDSGRNISRQGRETYSIRYRLSDRLSLTGEYDEYDAINAGIRLRVFSR